MMTRPIRFTCTLAALVTVGLPTARAAAQDRPATIPTVVAQATGFPSLMAGAPQYFDARLPDGWPAGFVPSDAKVLGGSVSGDSSMFLMRTAVFELTNAADSGRALVDLLTRAGYVEHDPARASRRGGFVATTGARPGTPYCRDSTLALFGPVDPAHAPRVHFLTLIGGEAGRQSCGAQRPDEMRRQHLVDVPALEPPAGVAQIGGSSSSWGGEGGSIGTSLRATMPADSVLAHYTAQLVAAGWRTDGPASVAESIGVQRFTFRQGDGDWVAGLFVLGAGDRQQIRLEFARKN